MKIFKIVPVWLFGIGIFFSLNGCIKDDVVQDRIDPTIRITNPLDTIGINATYQFETEYLNSAGQKENVNVIWESSDTTVISIDVNGLARGNFLGSDAMITLKTLTSPSATTIVNIPVVTRTVASQVTNRTTTLNSTSIYTLGGNAVLENNNGTVTLTLSSNYFADTSLPGLYVYLSNSTNTNAGALEIGAVTTFNGAHSYTLPSGTDINAYQHVLYFCKPFGQRVGHGTLN